MTFTAVFAANDGVHGEELWVTDGTAAGTHLLDDINPGADASDPTSFFALPNGKVFFFAGNTEESFAAGNFYFSSPWVTNGTAAGTYQLAKIAYATENLQQLRAPLGNGRVVFAATGNYATLANAYDSLWSTDGTAAGTDNLLSPGSNHAFHDYAALGNGRFFTKDIFGSALVTDGSRGGTYTPVTTVNGFYPFPSYVTSIGDGDVLFAAVNSIGTQIRLASGTPTDITTASAGAPVVQFTMEYQTTITGLGDAKALFVATGGSAGTTELWFVNGGGPASMAGDTGSATELSGAAIGSQYRLISDPVGLGNGDGLFETFDAAGNSELWITDGTPTGTMMLPGVAHSQEGPGVFDPTSLGNGDALFGAFDSTVGAYDLWITDGTNAGTHPVQASNSPNIAFDPYDITSLGDGGALFASFGDLWITDGTSDGTSMVSVIDPAGPAAIRSLTLIPCFAAGTRLLGEDGREIPVERIRPGERLMAAWAGGPVPVRWVGYRRIDCRRHPKPETVWPVRIAAGAFGADLPYRDLWLSPDHAVYTQDVLIPIKHLVNGTSIAQVPVDEVTYYHVELPQHDVLLAEGLQAESYLDTDDKWNFSNGGQGMRLFPDFSSHPVDISMLWEAKGCAPLVVYGPEFDAARQQVSLQAAALVPQRAAA